MIAATFYGPTEARGVRSLFPVILCGGAGSRLWPVSRELYPKPFIYLSDGESLLQKAFLRAANLSGTREILAVTNREFVFQAQDHFHGVNATNLPTAYVLEPSARNTAAAIAAAALDIRERHGPQAVMLVLPADHLIRQTGAFAEAVLKAMELAADGRLVTFGIKPEGPETGYGYIEANGNDVKRFVEKPALGMAREFVASGRYYWNAGMFCFTAQAILDEMAVHCPDVLSAVEGCVALSLRTHGQGLSQLALETASFQEVPSISVDHAVMERSKKIAVVPCDIGWSDIGSWSSISELTEPDASGNRVEGQAVLHAVSDCYIRSERLVGAVGVDGLVIIDTADALLVASKARSQDVRQVYAELKSAGHEAHRLHHTAHRPWGTYTVLEEGPGYKIKRIEVKPGASLSLQMHHHRSEHWVVVSGTATVVNGGREFTVPANESTFIPAGTRHRLSNSGTESLAIIEVQSGNYLGEDDIVRFADVYNRVTM